MPKQRKDMSAVIERLEHDLETVKQNTPLTLVEAFGPIAQGKADCNVPDTGDVTADAKEVGRRLARVLTALMRQRGYQFSRLAREAGVPAPINVRRILSGGWVLLHVGHFAKLCLALGRTPAQVWEEAMKKHSPLFKLGEWTDADLRSVEERTKAGTASKKRRVKA